MTAAPDLPQGDGFRHPRPRRPKAPALKTRNQIRSEREPLGAGAIAQLQEERYALWPLEAQQYARQKDVRFPLWSCTHRWRPASDKELSVAGGGLLTTTSELQWSYDWSSAAAIYVGGDYGLRELSTASGIAERRMFWASSRYGWAQQKETHRILREQDEKALDITQVADAARTDAIRSHFTSVGMNLLNHCMAALNRAATEIEPRDIAPLMDKAIRLIGAGQKMPTEYRHSVVDNPSANPTLNTAVFTGPTIVTSEAAVAELAALNERLQALGAGRGSAAVLVPPVSVPVAAVVPVPAR